MSDNNTNVYQRLNEARKSFHAKTQTKTGKNEYANYTYFELSDFLPDALECFDAVGLCGLISFGTEFATMKIVNIDTLQSETISCPMSTAALKGCHPVQNLGAVQTYLRRYLWAAAVELVDADKVDAGEVIKQDSETLPKDKHIEKFVRKPAPSAPPSSGAIQWKGRIQEVKKGPSGTNANGPWQVYFIEMEDGDSASTFKDDLAKDAEIIRGQEVTVLVEPNRRQPGKWTYLGFEPGKPPQATMEEELGWKE